MKDLVLEAKKRIHHQGGRMTAQRRLIFDILQDASDHPTAEELYQLGKQRDPSLHISTVYRTLRWLEQEGLVSSRVFDDEHHQERFDPVVSRNEHYHFVCNSCKTVIEFDTLLVNTIKAQFELHSGARVDVGSVVLYGLCAECRQKQDGTE
jgi:Fe2+ or Zn2+ uptake regulation protein